MRVAAILVMWLGPFENFSLPPTSEGYIWNLVSIGLVVLEEKSFEIVDGRRRRTTEPSHPISSPGAFGSGELKTRQSLKVMNAPAICNCDLDLASIRLKCQLVLDIVTINICVDFPKSVHKTPLEPWQSFSLNSICDIDLRTTMLKHTLVQYIVIFVWNFMKICPLKRCWNHNRVFFLKQQLWPWHCI